MPTLYQRFKSYERALAGPERYLDLRFDVRAFMPEDDRRRGIATGPELLSAGGRWDKTAGRFLDPLREGDAESRVIIGAEESQLAFVQWAAQWIAAYRDGLPRDTTLAMLAGDRRGGKTFIAVAFIVACCMDAPIAADGTPLIAWIVCKSFRERFETEQWILTRIPPAWYHHVAAPVHEFRFTHGPTLRLISADDDDATKQGRVDVAFINEPQKMGPRAVANAVLGSADLGGLVVLAANPPRGDTRGEWLFDVKEAIDDEEVERARGKIIDPLGVKYFHFDSKKNKSIDQTARRRSGRIATLIDPTMKAGEVEGEWRRPQERAFWEFDKHRHLHAVPRLAPGLVDVTREVGCERGEWGEWGSVAGVDFDWMPHIVAVVYRIFGFVDDPLFWAVDEFTGEQRWTTEQWIDAFGDWGERHGYGPQSTLLIGDASSGRRSHKSDPKTEGTDRNSFEIIRAAERDGAHWTIIPPQDHRGKTGVARNPFVDERLDLANDLLREAEERSLIAGGRSRLRIDPIRCPWLAECARQATTERKGARRKLVHNKFAHALDAATYPIWRLSPAPGSTGGGSGPPMITIPVKRGENIY